MIRFNHLNVSAKRNSHLHRLFTQVLGLDVGLRPHFPFEGQWLYQGDEALVHVIEAESEEPILGHLAFDVEGDLDTLLQMLAINGFKPEVRQVPDSDMIQVFVCTGDLLLELIISTKNRLSLSDTESKFAIFDGHEEL